MAKKLKLSSSSISIIIPIFNASSYITRAVKSALAQKETAEVILVEDGSTDNSYAICKSLTKKYDKVHLFIHEGHKNKGAGASRNLGIKKANCDFIAFLDADDYYHDNRFFETKQVFHNKTDADGVYEAIGVHIDSEDAEVRWQETHGGRKITTIEAGINPNELFWYQSPIGSKGYTSLDGLTVKKSALMKIGLFDPTLRLHQDSDLFMRLALACILYPGEVEKPVAMRRVHLNNRISKERSFEEIIYHQKKMWNSTYTWALNSGYTKEAKELKQRLMISRIRTLNKRNNFSAKDFRHFSRTIKNHPSVLLEKAFYKLATKILIKYLLSMVGYKR